MSAWEVDLDVQPDVLLHVWPTGDLIEHETDGAACPCGPALEEHGNGVVMVTHHSLDGREAHE